MSSSSELASGKLVLDEPAPHVARLRISNPEKRGALDHEILDTLAETVRSADARCLLITGDGPVFSAGYDIGSFDDERAFSHAAEKLVAHPFHEALEAVDAYRYPVVAAINGHAIGGGLELALSCDVRIAARGVKMGMPPAKIGLIYSHTGLRRFIEICGVANTSELFLVGRNVDADRGYEMGLVNRVVERDELDDLGMVCDLDVLDAALLTTADRVRDANLETIQPEDADAVTVEVFARWVHGQLADAIRGSGADVLTVRVWESDVAFGGYAARIS